MVKKIQDRDQTVTVVDTLTAQIEELQDANARLGEIVSKLTNERRQLLGEEVPAEKDAEQRAYELMAQLVEKVTNQRNAANRKINAVLKQLIR